VTQSTLRITGAFWRLDASLAYRRHFPAINWNGSYSLYLPLLERWYRANLEPDYSETRDAISRLLQQEASLQEMLQLVGPDALQDQERLVIEAGRIIREAFLQQDAFHENDAYCSMGKAQGIMKMILNFYQQAKKALGTGVTIDDLIQNPVLGKISQARFIAEDHFQDYRDEVLEEIDQAFQPS